MDPVLRVAVALLLEALEVSIRCIVIYVKKHVSYLPFCSFTLLMKTIVVVVEVLAAGDVVVEMVPLEEAVVDFAEAEEMMVSKIYSISLYILLFKCSLL